jgi:hypothetical protein
LLIDNTATVHPSAPQKPRECHLYIAEGCHLYIAATFKSRIVRFLENRSLAWRLTSILEKRLRLPIFCKGQEVSMGAH